MQVFQKTGKKQMEEFDNTLMGTVTGSRGVGRNGMEKIT
jgi:hypothetical protein